MSKATHSADQANNLFAIPVAKLAKSPLNARKTVSKAACEEMKASLLAHGLMQNLIVTDNGKGKYEVVAGARRMAALKALQDEGKLPADHEVLCQIVSDTHAYEMSLAENTVRHAMHPADEHAAYAVLIDSGENVEAISQRFGKTVKYIEQRLKLGRAAPELIQEYREGNISLETLEAYTITDDRKRQMKVYKATKDGWQRNNAREIRALLTDIMVNADSKLAKFVGLGTYEKAGGMVKRDLFGEDVYLENPQMLNALVEEKLRLAAEEIKAEGWAWVETAVERDYGFLGGFAHLEPEPVDAPQDLVELKAKLESESEAASSAYYDYEGGDDAEEENLERRHSELETQLEELNDKLESFVRFTPEQMSAAGCYAYISHAGKLEIEKGLAKKGDAKKLAKSQDESDDAEQEEKPKGMSESLKTDLKAYRLGVAQAEIAKNPAIAFDLLVFKLACDFLAPDSVDGIEDGTAIREWKGYEGPRAGGEAQSFAEAHLQAAKEGLSLGWMKPESEAERFLTFQQLPEAEKHKLLAYCVAASLKPKLAPAEDEDKTAYDIALAQTGGNVADYWRPTAANFLSRITHEQLIAIGRDDLFPRNDHWLRQFKDAKKSALVAELDKSFALSNKPNTIDAIKQWLPAGMAFGAAPEPKPAKAKKGKKAA